MENPIQIIEQALNVATLKGVYSLKDVETILQALNELKIKSNP
jgi:ferric-dicitrate binding protein FerR (iron transport regulator)